MADIQVDEHNWIEEIVKAGHHFRIVGECGSGKSTLATNLVNVLRQTYPDLKLTVLNPKSTSSDVKAFENLIDQRSRETGEGETSVFLAHEIDGLMIAARNQKNPQENEQIVRQSLLKGMNLARSRVKVIYTAQSSACSRTGLGFNTFDDSVNIFLGERMLRERYGWRGQQYYKFCCLVKAPGHPPFIAAMPEAGHSGILN